MFRVSDEHETGRKGARRLPDSEQILVFPVFAGCPDVDQNTLPKNRTYRGVSRIFERGGPISLGSLKKGHQILKGGGSMV